MLTHEKNRPHLAALSGLAATALFLLLLFGPCFSAHAESFDFYAATNVTAGDVVIWDTSDANAKAVKTADDQFSMDVVGIAAESASAGNDVRVRFSGGKVACNISGTIDITSNPWLVVSSTTGKAEGLSSRRAGTFAKAITNTGDPQAGQCYVALNVGLSAYGVGGEESDHGNLSGHGDDDHSQYHNDARGDARYFRQSEHLDSSAGAGDAGKPIKLDAGGKVDATMLADADVDHGSIGGLGDDDHSQYHNNTRGDARYLYRENAGAFTPDGDYEPATKKYVDDNDKFTVGTSFPGAPSAGDLFYHTTHKILFEYENSSWNPIINYGATLALYADTGTGSDTTGKGYGPTTDAAATIQWLWDNCVPATFNGIITMNVTPESYSETLIFSGKTRGTSTAEVILLGTLTNVDTGEADNDSTTSAIEDDGQGWTPSAHAGKLLRITSGDANGQERFIRDNDADTLDVGGRFTTAPDGGSDTFSIDTLGTSIAPGAGNTALFITDQSNVTIKYIKFDAGKYAVLLGNGSQDIEIQSCEFDTQTNNGINIGKGSNLKVNTAYIHAVGLGGINVINAVASLFDVYVLGCNTSNNAAMAGVKLTMNSYVVLSRCYIDGNNRYGVYNQFNSSLQMSVGASVNTITNHDTVGDVGVKSTYGGMGYTVVGQTYPVGTNDDDEDADAATGSFHS